jgi:hypothetical protein
MEPAATISTAYSPAHSYSMRHAGFQQGLASDASLKCFAYRLAHCRVEIARHRATCPLELHRDRGHIDALEPTRDDDLEAREVNTHVKREAVVRDPAPDADADGRDLTISTCRRRVLHKDARLSINAPRLEIEGAKRLDQRVFDRTKEAVHIAGSFAALREVHNRVAHKLAGRVKGDVPASRDFEALDTARRELLGRAQQVLGLRAAAERDNGRMFEQQKLVGAGTELALFEGLELKVESFAIRNSAEPTRLEPWRALAQSSNSAASRSSRIRNRKPFAGEPSTAR